MEAALPNRGMRSRFNCIISTGQQRHGLLGEVLPRRSNRPAKTPFAPRCVKDRVEEDLFAHRRDLFTDLQLVFFDTTSIYFEGEGGESLESTANTRRIIARISSK